MKAAPVMGALGQRTGTQVLVHTGQHYDASMSDVFFRQLGLPEPDCNLGVGSGSHAHQTAAVMERLEPVLRKEEPDLVLTYGDVNSTLAAALVCAKLLIPVAHVEAGLRSFDRTMPEEINRVLTDQISDLLFTPSADAGENLLREGIAAERIHFVGNVMVDTLVRLLPQALDRWKRGAEFKGLELEKRDYGLVTLHRPSNVDDPQMLDEILGALIEISHRLPLVFPIHPRTYKRMEALDLRRMGSSLYLIEPVGYLDFLALQRDARLVITDSGGIQEETTYLNVPCITVRENTERPVTVTQGTNTLVDQDMERLKRAVEDILAGNGKVGETPPLWDGRASERIADIVIAFVRE